MTVKKNRLEPEMWKIIDRKDNKWKRKMEWNQGIDELFILYKSREYLIPLILEKSKEVSNFLAFGKLKEFVPNAINLLVKF